MTTPNPNAVDELPSGNGPEAHEDLTIAEQLDQMRDPHDRRPGEVCLVSSEGQKYWVSDSALEQFLRDHGAEHSSDYLASHGVTWEADLFQSQPSN